MNRTKLSSGATWGLYLFAAVLVTSPLIDLVSTAWPPRVTDLSWRYGFFGLAAGYLHTPMIGMVLAMAVAYLQEHVGALRALGVVCLVTAVLLLPVLALWPMDVLQMRDLRAPEVRRGVLIGGVIQEIKYVGACIVLALLGTGCLQLAAAPREARRQAPGILSTAGATRG
ncbi:MAG: hypothetical protein AB7T31_01725 [Gemmatimonadales bacterium]